MNTVVIVLSGGVVQAVHADEPIKIHIVDHDTEGIPEDELEGYVMNIFYHPSEPDTLGMAKTVLREELNQIRSNYSFKEPALKTKVTFNSYECFIRFGHYPNGRIALDLVDQETEELVATATVNVAGKRMPQDCILIKDYSENAGMFEQLHKQGIVGPAIEKVRVSEFEDNVILCKLLIPKSRKQYLEKNYSYS